MQAGSVSDVVGHTPLIKLQSLSKITGCEIFAKAEYLNPGGSVKDRTALGIIQSAEKQGLLKPGDTIVEGTAGNTGIGLATLAAQRGYHCVIVMPDNQSKEKYHALEALGVELVKVAPCPFANPNHFYHTARALAESRPNSFWANQFENTANFEIHYKTTGPEIWEQMGQRVDAFVSSVGTGGTLAGVSAYLKEQDPKVFTLLADPMGSGLYSFVKSGKFEAQGSSITEGIGIMRLTENFKKARVDEAVQIHDEQMLSMLYYLAQHEGLLVGTSAALNIFASYQYALQNQGKGLRIATVMGDSALRYQSKVFNPQFLNEKNLKIMPLIHS
ncbi:cysteine synthase A [Bdellovibrio bacteriovorus]|uniref:CysM protein n=1 Tax=Bdellovibrio bacteriovorus (strain ATCC 15356 / DSM 50701 / NCIMB 9529 / HD100) TaxID=264462 RepID=Q6MM94_BDEBA|nr:cysteine synthase A [Bdellovibrio bacteriovorus]AHZ84265.1 cysteine synthase [Bdellovibrio bacteriovorus]BEV68151.1 Cysteine synthase [Bdellovibrio bacteriovorus]CAE79611.1 cysM [Bdellovibrio bacteriovorus HD100]